MWNDVGSEKIKMEELDQQQQILTTFFKGNSTCCECNAGCNLSDDLTGVVSEDTARINVHLGVTLCKDCSNVLAYLESDFAHNIAYQTLCRLKFPLHIAYVNLLVIADF